jgi:hypothetical protein
MIAMIDRDVRDAARAAAQAALDLRQVREQELAYHLARIEELVRAQHRLLVALADAMGLNEPPEGSEDHD